MPKTKGLAQVERLFFILQYLSNHDYATAGQLAEHCETSLRTIYRDMKKLENQGFFLVADSQLGYQLIEQPARAGRLSNEEWMALSLYSVLSQGMTAGQHPFHQAYTTGLEKIVNLVQKGSKSPHAGVGELDQRIRLHAKPADSSQVNVMPAILTAISNNITLEVMYYTIHRDVKTKRRLDPYYLVPREGQLYLIAYCHKREDIRVFRLSRFHDAILTENSFKLKRNFDIDVYLSQRWSIISEDPETRFVVRFSEIASRYVQESDFHVETKRSVQKDRTMLLEATVKSKEEFLRWIRSFGTNAEVLEPKEVREMLLKESAELVEMYRE